MIFVNKPFLYKVFLTILVKSSFQKNSFKSSPQDVLQNILSEYFLSINLFSIVFSHKLLVKKFFPKNFLQKFPTECSPKHFHLFSKKFLQKLFWIRINFVWNLCCISFVLKIIICMERNREWVTSDNARESPVRTAASLQTPHVDREGPTACGSTARTAPCGRP
jgi:hypothetical protein